MGHPMSQTRSARRAQCARTRYVSAVFLLDQKDLSRAERPCSCCRRVFQPTTRRRMMCSACYRNASPLDESGIIPWY